MEVFDSQVKTGALLNQCKLKWQKFSLALSISLTISLATFEIALAIIDSCINKDTIV